MPGLSKSIIIFILVLILPGKEMFSETFFEEKRYDIDSLKQVLMTASGEERVRTLCLLAGQFRIEEADTSIVYAEEAYQLSRGTGDENLDLLATYTLGLAYHHAGDYPKAIRYSLDAKELALIQHDTAMYYQVMHCVGFSYFYSNNPDLFINVVHEAMEYLEAWKDPARQFEKQIRIGWAYMQTGKYREAIPYYLEAASFADSTTLVSSSKIGLNYAHIVNCYLKIEKYDSAKIFLDLYELFCKDNGMNCSYYTYAYKGEYFFFLNDLDSALYYYKMEVDFADRNGELPFQTKGLSEIGKIYRLRGEIDQALVAFREAAEIADRIRELKSFNIDKDRAFGGNFTPEQSVHDYHERSGLHYLIIAHLNLYEIYKSTGDQKNALIHLEAFNEASNRMRELDRKKDVMEVNTRYETERKEQQIKLLTSENELNALKLEQTQYFLFALAGFILLAILVAILLIRQNRMKTMQDKTILEQRLLRAQMNPHFLFNTLSNIQSYMLENDAVKANHYLSRFSRLMRNILDNTARESVPLDQELSTIENYLELQKLRYQGRFDYQITVDENIDPETTFIPPMLAQPFIENAIEHGIKHSKEKGMINVQLFNCSIAQLFNGMTGRLQNGMIEIIITDNGVGREESARIERPHSKDHRPMATSITRERLQVLGHRVSRKLRRKIKLEITDLYDEEGKSRGTKVRIVIPAENDHP